MQKGRKFWSCIKKDTDFYSLTKEQQIEILLKGGLYASIDVASSPELNIKDGVLYLPDIRVEQEPVQELKDEFYAYILEIFKVDIDNYFYLFFKDFNDVVFGMEHIEQKAIALKAFKEIYDNVDIKVDFQNKEISKNGIENSTQINRFLKLKGMRSGMCSTLAKYESLIAYLSGNKDYFISDKFKEDEIFLSMLDFERQLKVILSLNDRYQFEEDIAFSKLGKLKDAYKLYQNLFSSFDVFRYTNNFIEELTENKPSNIDSLHQSLLELNLILPKKESFINYVNREHNIPITKVRNYARDINRFHDFRLQKIKEDLKELTS